MQSVVFRVNMPPWNPNPQNLKTRHSGSAYPSPFPCMLRILANKTDLKVCIFCLNQVMKPKKDRLDTLTKEVHFI